MRVSLVTIVTLKKFLPSIISGPVTVNILSNFSFGLVYTLVMFRTSTHTKWAGYSYEYNHEDYVNGFGEANFDTPYWLGLKKMKRITDEGRVDLVVFYDDYFDVFFDFKLLDQDFQMTYGYFEGAAGVML